MCVCVHVRESEGGGGAYLFNIALDTFLLLNISVRLSALIISNLIYHRNWVAEDVNSLLLDLKRILSVTLHCIDR